MRRVVIDTNVLIAGLRSRHGASNKLLSLIGTNMFVTAISVPLVLEYEEATQRHAGVLPYSRDELNEIVDFICAHSEAHPIYYLWRPSLPDPKDHHVLEIAVAAQCDTIITFNRADFKGIHRFGIQVQTPGAFLKEVNP
jgi:putative PIN family toxin of toxin-antitoxin system